MDKNTVKRYPLGETAWQWTIGNEVDLQVNRVVIGLTSLLFSDVRLKELGVHDIVPSYHSFAVYFSEHMHNRAQIADLVEQTMYEALNQGDKFSSDLINYTTHVLEVRYNGADLQRVADYHALTIEDVIRIHSTKSYSVATIGFLPHFPYLLGLDSRLETPRLAVPRSRVPAGSVAIGGCQTGIYPQESPGGWNILGQTDPEKLTLIQPGDIVQFECLSL